jgi:DNA-binding GntR family transcriptional regulator
MKLQQPIKPISAVDAAKGYLEDKIVKGIILPGQKIKEEDISAQLNISRSPIREAFKILEGEGLIVRKPNRGVFVSQITEKDVLEVYGLLEWLYDLALTLGFDLISDKEIRKLEGFILEMESCVQRHSPKVIARYQDLNSLFHCFFANIAGNQRLSTFLSNLNAQIRRLSYQAFLDLEHMRRSNQEHGAILDAVRKGDRENALRLTRLHVGKISQVHQKIVTEVK